MDVLASSHTVDDSTQARMTNRGIAFVAEHKTGPLVFSEILFPDCNRLVR
jgi:hypothetical protein